MGSYSFAAYSCLANEREYSTKSADAVFKNRSLSAKSDIKLSNVDARTYNTQRLLRLSLLLMLLVQCVEHLMK